MASKEHKIVRRAEAMAQLVQLSGQLAEQFNVEPVQVNATNWDAELAEIQRIESLNELLRKVLDADKSDAAELTIEAAKKPVVKRTHGPKQ